MTTSSTVARWELAHRIKVRRNELDIGVDQIAKHLGFTRNFFSAVEHERSMLAADKLEMLLDFLDFDDTEKNELRALDESARQRGWWESKDVVDLFGDDNTRFFGLEQGCAAIRLFESLSIPGLLQQREYARASALADPFFGPAQVDQLTDIRMRRQLGIQRRGTPMTALLSEAALRQQWTDREGHIRQLEMLLEMASGEQLVVHVLPFDRPIGTIAGSSTLNLMRFESPKLPAVAFQESIRGLGILEQRDPQYERLRVAWEDGRDRALSADESVVFIADIASQL